jgi:putative FmdB family regulatory protein
MPLYEYECKKCHHRFERIQKFSDPYVKKCPDCGGPVEMVVSAPAVQFKGSGWYVTDYAKKSSATSPSNGESGSKQDSGSKGESDSKADSKTDSESKGEPESKSKKEEKSKHDTSTSSKKTEKRSSSRDKS